MRGHPVLALLLGLLALSQGATALPEAALQADAVVFADYDDLDPETDTLLILDPRIGFTQPEARHLHEFLEGGGRLLVAGLSGSAPELLARMETGIEAARGELYSLADEETAYVQGQGPWAGVGETRMQRDVPPLEGPGMVLLETHPYTWLDLDHDGEPDLREPRGNFTVGMQLTIGTGSLLVLSDHHLALDEAPPELQALLHEWAHGDTTRTILLEVGKQTGDRPTDIARMVGDSDALYTLVLVLTVLLPVAALGPRLRRRPTAPRRVRPLPPARDRYETRALEELRP